MEHFREYVASYIGHENLSLLDNPNQAQAIFSRINDYTVNSEVIDAIEDLQNRINNVNQPTQASKLCSAYAACTLDPTIKIANNRLLGRLVHEQSEEYHSIVRDFGTPEMQKTLS